MVSVEQELTQELVRVRRGWGLHDRSFRDRIGPHLTRLCGIAETVNDREARDRIRTWLAEHAAGLPGELVRAAVMAFALDRDHQYRQLTQRIEHLASEQSCSSRTARRRMDHAIRLLAHAAVHCSGSSDADPEAGWHVRTMRAAMHLDTDPRELHETRVITAVRDGLRQVVVRLSVPAPLGMPDMAPTIVTAVADGAEVTAVEQRFNAQHFRWLLDLPRPLRTGEAHVFTMVYRIPPDRPLRPHYAFLPLHPCDHFELRIRYPRDRLPTTVWRLDAIPPRLLDDEQPGPNRVSVDESGEVRLVFTAIKQGYAYGVMWTPRPRKEG